MCSNVKLIHHETVLLIIDDVNARHEAYERDIWECRDKSMFISRAMFAATGKYINVAPCGLAADDVEIAVIQALASVRGLTPDFGCVRV